MFKKYYWQQPLFKHDLITVVVFGIIAMILGGILTGLIDALVLSIGMRIRFSLLLNSLIVGYTVKKCYANYHILYPVLALVFFLFSLFFTYLGYNFGVLGLNADAFEIVFTSPSTYYSFIVGPIISLINVFKAFDFFNFLFAILNIIFYVLGFYAVYRIAKGNN